ncbi:ABC transporter ATP-binding protein [uncultured Enterovirga sp.]|uniref:ABC transporter ATP-binding protein n=1 Tax=uncultured Enterovirga sp. TaxID=2026352 RepID=UPI0035CAAA40
MSADRLRRALRDRLGALQHLPALFKLVWAASPPLTVASIVLRLVRALLPVVMLYVAKLILDAVVAERALPHAALGPAEWFGDGHLSRIGFLVALELALAILSDLLGRSTTLVDGLLAELSSNAITLRLMSHAATLDLEQFEDSAIQDGLERARRQVAWRSNLISQVLGQAQDALTVVSLAIGLVAYLPWLIALLVLALIPAFLNELHFNRRGYRLAYQRTPERRQVDYLRYLGAGVESAKEIKLFGLNDYLTSRFRTLADRMVAENRSLAVDRAAWGGLFAALGTVAYYAAYAVIVWRTVAGAFTIGDLTFLAGSFLRLRGLIEGLLLGVSQISGQAQHLDDLFSFFQVEPRIRSPAQPAPFPLRMVEGFRFEDVGFRYPGSATWALRHLNLTIRAGEVVALVGENGAGKTTIVKLLARLYEPSEGRILLDGRDLRDYDLEAVRSRIGVIFQDFVRFDFTAADNIAVGRISERDNRTRIEAAARRSLADGVVSRWPAGYDQLLGRRFADGVDLSGGEWQKIAIARAYMRQAEILILDEPTAALDARAEFEVFKRFGDLAEGRTAILISHRFSTVRIADRILVLSGGEVIESGSHDELVARNGRYAELFELQAAGYR